MERLEKTVKQLEKQEVKEIYINLINLIVEEINCLKRMIANGKLTPIIEELKAMTDLKISIVELTSELKAVHQRDVVRDERITVHGKEIDKLKIDVENHGQRIKALENDY